MVWITLAFALSNREFFTERLKFDLLTSKTSRNIIGLTLILSSIAGCIYISSGIYGNYLLRRGMSAQDANMRLYYFNEANKHPIVREEVQRSLGHHYIQLGEHTNNPEDLLRGFNILWEQFHREPHSEDISRLLNFAQRYQLEPVIREIASYFRPGDYHLKRITQKDSSGRTVRALLLVNGPGSDDK